MNKTDLETLRGWWSSKYGSMFINNDIYVLLDEAIMELEEISKDEKGDG